VNVPEFAPNSRAESRQPPESSFSLNFPYEKLDFS
jgi:hypothetical protein